MIQQWLGTILLRTRKAQPAALQKLLRARTRCDILPLCHGFSTFNARYNALDPKSTTQTPLHQHIPPPQPSPPPPKKPRRSRFWRNVIYASCFLCFGLVSGSVVRFSLVPPLLPAPDSPEDEALLSKLRRDLGDLPIVKELRGHQEQWTEYDAYASLPVEAKRTSMTARAMHGSRGLGIQRIFWNEEEKRLINVVFLGGYLTGWPGVVHGGAVATMLHESLERVANGPEFGGSLGSGGSGFRSGEGMVLQKVSFDYRKPTGAHAFYVVKAEVDLGEDGAQEPPGAGRKVKATLENARTGVLCAEASGYCVPRGTSLPLADLA